MLPRYHLTPPPPPPSLTLDQVRANVNDPPQAIDAVKAAALDQNEVLKAISELTEGGEQELRERLAKAAGAITSSLKDLMNTTRALDANPTEHGRNEVALSATEVEKLALALLGDVGTVNALNNLRYAAKLAAAALYKLATSSALYAPEVDDKHLQAQLKNDVKASSTALVDFLAKLQGATQDPRNFVKQNELLEAALFQLPTYAELVSTSKTAADSLADQVKKTELDNNSSEASNALRLLAKAVANVSNLSGDATLEQVRPSPSHPLYSHSDLSGP